MGKEENKTVISCVFFFVSAVACGIFLAHFIIWNLNISQRLDKLEQLATQKEGK